LGLLSWGLEWLSPGDRWRWIFPARWGIDPLLLRRKEIIEGKIGATDQAQLIEGKLLLIQHLIGGGGSVTSPD